MNRTSPKVVVPCLALLLLCQTRLLAQTTVWTDMTGDWFVAGNWDNGVPNSGVDAQINNGGNAQIAAAGATSNALTLGLNAGNSGTLSLSGVGTLVTSGAARFGDSGSGTLSITAGAKLTTPVAILGFNAGSTGTATVTGAGSMWNNGNQLIVGFNGSGTVNVLAGATVLQTGNGIIVGLNTGSDGHLTVNAATLNASGLGGNLDIGAQGTGEAMITNGGDVMTQNTTIGGSGGNGTASIDGAGSTWSANQFFVGGSGPGSLTVTGGAAITSTFGFIGNFGTGVGTVTITGTGSTWMNSMDFIVGNQGTGTLNIQVGGSVSSGDSTIGDNPAGMFDPISNGTVNVDGMGSTWTITGNLLVGNGGIGALHITNGGAVSNVNADLGNDLGSSGMVTVDGMGSTWTITGFFDIGVDGTGTFSVTNGATVTTTRQAAIGEFDGTGSASVDGAGSTWTISDGLAVGENGTGSLSVTNGGAVSNTFAVVGEFGTGTATVDGMGSTWTNSDRLTIGEFGVGTLSILNGGVVSNTDGLIGDQPGASGTVIVDGSGSTWTNNNNLYVGGNAMGSGGAGRLEITNSAVVNASILTVIYDQGSILDDATLTTTAVSILGGLLEGNGVVNGDVSNSGFVSPGDAVGTLTVNGGNYFQSATGTLISELGGLNDGVDSDLLRVSLGAATINGTVRLVRVNNFMPSPGDEVTILAAQFGRTGEFASVELVNWGLIHPVPQYDRADEVYVIFELSPFSGVSGLTRNQRCVAENLDEAALLSDPDAVALVIFLGNNVAPEDLPAAFNLIAPEELASIYEIGFSNAILQGANFQRRLSDIRFGARSSCWLEPKVVEQSYAGGKTDGKVMLPDKNAVAPVPACPDRRWGSFAMGSWQSVDVDGDHNARGYEIDQGSFTAGVDYLITKNFAVGLGGGYARSNADLVADGKVDVDQGFAGLYASFFGGGFYADAVAMGGWNDYDTRRTGLQALHERGSTNGAEFNGLIGGGYDWRVGCFTVGPTASFQYTYIEIDSFTEHGDSLAPLHFPDQDEDAARSTVGVKAAFAARAGNIVFRPEARAAWQHEFNDTDHAIEWNFAFSDNHTCSVFGPGTGRDSALIDAGISVMFGRCQNVSAYVFYNGNIGRENYQRHGVSGGISFGF